MVRLMKTPRSLALVLLVLCVASAQAGQQARSRFGGGVRYYSGHDTEIAAPFDNDTSYGLVYEYHEGGAFWQFGVSYATSMGSNDVDAVITPEINLMASDGGWRGGMGVLASYIETEDDDDWSDIYYQFILGFDIPIGSLALSVQTYYVFDDFDNLDEFDIDELDVSAYLMYQF
jgi:hypothetical protein